MAADLLSQVGAPILRKAGRGTVLTPTGEVLLSYARRLLDLNDEAAHAVRGADLKGELRLGVQEDFGESLLTLPRSGVSPALIPVSVPKAAWRGTLSSSSSWS
jgi:DNA-binding transcriptional LysR family regulator